MWVFQPVKQAFCQLPGLPPSIALCLPPQLSAALNAASVGCFLAPTSGGREGKTARGVGVRRFRALEKEGF